MGLCGTAKDHCCWLGRAGKCPHVEPNPEEGFNWRCSLRHKLGSWDAVHASPEYTSFVRPALDAAGVAQDCGSWPPIGQTCKTCGEVGHG